MTRFPCPICTLPQDVLTSKKDKPYITCNRCGVQVFIRGRVGIAEFKQLLERSEREGLFTRVNETIRRYRLTCPQCFNQFWIEPRLIKTSIVDGSLKGIRCPRAQCKAVLPWDHTA